MSSGSWAGVGFVWVRCGYPGSLAGGGEIPHYALTVYESSGVLPYITTCGRQLRQTRRVPSIWLDRKRVWEFSACPTNSACYLQSTLPTLLPLLSQPPCLSSLRWAVQFVIYWRCARIAVVNIFIDHINHNIVGLFEWIMLPNLVRPLSRSSASALLLCQAAHKRAHHLWSTLIYFVSGVNGRCILGSWTRLARQMMRYSRMSTFKKSISTLVPSKTCFIFR
jgi:hypothetical protein